MWFTQVSLRNPVFATMVMLAFVVLGLFSLARLQVDQFPNVDLPVVVVTTEYPGAAPGIVESEVTKKMEEAVNSIAGINALYSRSYESQSVVVIEFQLHINGRKAADDVREKVATDYRDAEKRKRFVDHGKALRARLEAAVKAGKSFADAAQAEKLEVKTFAAFTLRQDLDAVVTTAVEAASRLPQARFPWVLRVRVRQPGENSGGGVVVQ